MATFAFAFKGFFSQQNILFFIVLSSEIPPQWFACGLLPFCWSSNESHVVPNHRWLNCLFTNFIKSKCCCLGGRNILYVFTGKTAINIYIYICIWSYGNLNDISIKYPLLWSDSQIPLIHLATQKFGFLGYSIPSDKVHYCVVHCTTSATPLKGLIYALINKEALGMATFNANQRAIRREIMCPLIKLTQACISSVYVKHIHVSKW